MGKKNEGRIRGRISVYACFVQTCREEHRKKHPGQPVVFAEFAKKCADKWKVMSPREKQRFEEMAKRDKARFDREMANYVPPKGEKRKRTKDPNAPKRPLSAFFFYCAQERPKVRASNPDMFMAEVAKELGKRWDRLPERARFEEMATKDKERYEREMAAYRNGMFSGTKKAKPAASNKTPPTIVYYLEDDDDEDDDDDEEEDDDEENFEESDDD